MGSAATGLTKFVDGLLTMAPRVSAVVDKGSRVTQEEPLKSARAFYQRFRAVAASTTEASIHGFFPNLSKKLTARTATAAADLTGRLDAAEGRITLVEGRITIVEDRVDEQDKRLDGHDERHDGHDENLKELKARADRNSMDKKDFLNDLNVSKARIAVLEEEKELASREREMMAMEIAVLKEEGADAEARMTEAEGEVTAMRAEFASKLRALSDELAAQGEGAADLRVKVRALVKAKGQMRSRIGRMGEAIQSLKIHEQSTTSAISTLTTRTDLSALDAEANERIASSMNNQVKCVIAAEAAIIRAELVTVKAEFHEKLNSNPKPELTSAEAEDMETFLAEASRLAGI